MNVPLKNKSDQQLHLDLKALVRQEREILSEVLNHLKEIQLRRLYSDFKCASLWEYATQN